jgi:hypothetical protein
MQASLGNYSPQPSAAATGACQAETQGAGVACGKPGLRPRLGSFRSLANSAVLSRQTSGKTRSKLAYNMSCSIRYCRPGEHEDAGLLIIADESEFPIYKARLEASGYVVLGTPVLPPLVGLPGKSP